MRIDNTSRGASGVLPVATLLSEHLAAVNAIENDLPQEAERLTRLHAQRSAGFIVAD